MIEIASALTAREAATRLPRIVVLDDPKLEYLLNLVVLPINQLGPAVLTGGSTSISASENTNGLRALRMLPDA